MSFLNLISSEDRKLFNEADEEELKKQLYLVKCDTCGKIMFETHLGVIRSEIKSGKWNKPQPWFLFACRHWIEAHPNFLHQINVYRIFPSGTKELRFEITTYMNERRDKRKAQTKEELLADLEYEEKRLGIR